MKKNIFDTSLPENWSKQLYEEYVYDIAAKHIDKIVTVLFVATAEILNNAKSKDRPVAMVYEKLNKELAAAAFVQYFENEDPSQPGNYTLVWTFDAADIPEDAVRLTLDNINTHSYFDGVALSKFNFRYDSSNAITALNITTLAEIKKWLDENAKEDEEVTIEVPGVMEATVAVEGGVKVFAIGAAGEIKMLIKDDASIEK